MNYFTIKRSEAVKHAQLSSKTWYEEKADTKEIWLIWNCRPRETNVFREMKILFWLCFILFGGNGH